MTGGDLADGGPDFLRRRVRATPDRTALVDSTGDRTWTYRDLDSTVDRCLGRIRSRVEDPDGDGRKMDTGTVRVATVLEPRPAFVLAFHAAMRQGWTVVALHPRLSSAQLRARIGRTEPAVVVCEEETASVLQADVDSPPTVRPTALESPGREATGDGPVHEKRTPSRVAPDETVLVAFTSGTTGEARGVRLTRRNLHASAVGSAFRLGVSPDDRWLGCLPVGHVGGISPVVRCVVHGTTLVLQRSFDARATARVVDEFSVTGVSLVPTQLHRLLDTVDGAASLSTLQTVLLGGAPASGDLLDRARERGLSVYPTYGLTETASQVATARPDETRAHPGTVGQPLYGTTVTVVSDDDPVGPGERGELVVDGPTVTPGYLDEAATAEASGEWGLHTGDIGYRDGAGRLWVLGRQDDQILTGGELVAPSAVADTLRDHPAVEAVAVVGLQDEKWGERVGALLVPAMNQSTDSSAILDHCREHLAEYEIPKTIGFVDELPRTASGTVDREAVRSTLQDED